MDVKQGGAPASGQPATQPQFNALQRAHARKSELWTERTSWLDHWREINQYQMPRTGRFLVTDTNKGHKRHNNIIDNTPVFGIRTLASGLMSGMTSPARPWFRLGLRDKALMEQPAVKGWLHDTAELLRSIFATSNTYRALHACYEELGAYGTWADVVLQDFENVIHHYPLTIGEYALGTNHKGEVDTLVREFEMTVAQLVGEFGLDNVSPQVRSMYSAGTLQGKITVEHVIEPRRGRDFTNPSAKSMPWVSLYYEVSQIGVGKPLRESGFKRFCVLAPRWQVNANDVYGQSPGMEALGDVKQLQHQQLRKGQAIDQKVNPSLQVPSTLKDNPSARLPGGVFYYDSTGPSQGVRRAYDVDLPMGDLLEDIQDVRERVRSAFYADLFLMIASDTRSGVTATEIAERHEEKLLMLGPVLERLHVELLGKLIDITFDFCAEAGILPPVPPALEGVELNVEFISTLAQAQRAVAAGAVDRLVMTVGNIAAAKADPSVWDKVDVDQIVDDYGEMFGVNPEIIVPDDVVAAQREARAQQQQAMQAAAAMQPAADAAAKASTIDTGNLQDVMNMFAGYNSPSATEIGAA